MPKEYMRQETHTQTREMFERKKETALFARPGHSLDLEVLIEFLHDVSMLLPRQVCWAEKGMVGGGFAAKSSNISFFQMFSSVEHRFLPEYHSRFVMRKWRYTDDAGLSSGWLNVSNACRSYLPPLLRECHRVVSMP